MRVTKDLNQSAMTSFLIPLVLSSGLSCASGYVQGALPFGPVFGLYRAMHSFTAVLESSVLMAYVPVYSEYHSVSSA